MQSEMRLLVVSWGGGEGRQKWGKACLLRPRGLGLPCAEGKRNLGDCQSPAASYKRGRST